MTTLEPFWFHGHDGFTWYGVEQHDSDGNLVDTLHACSNTHAEAIGIDVVAAKQWPNYWSHANDGNDSWDEDEQDYLHDNVTCAQCDTEAIERSEKARAERRARREGREQ